MGARSVFAISLSAKLTIFNPEYKFSDRQILANSVDQIRLLLWSGSTLFAALVCIFWMYYSMIKPSCSNFRVITAKFSGV